MQQIEMAAGTDKNACTQPEFGMEFVTTVLRDRLLRELRRAASAEIAVAFFRPDAMALAALGRVPSLRLLVANDFQVNNPDSLETLSDHGHWVRAVSAELHGGNLHSKVYLVQRRDKSLWAMVGSANLTRPGLTTSQEACIILDSKHPEDVTALQEIRIWFDELYEYEYSEIDFDLARAVFNTRNRRNARGVTPAKPKESKKTHYWALKPGYCGEYWQNFLAEDVVAMGWGEMTDPSTMTPEEVVEAYKRAWPEDTIGQIRTNVAQLMQFTRVMGDDNLVFLCGRYDSIGKKDKNAYIYGVARTRDVGGRCYVYDRRSDWYRFKRHATIQRIEQYLPRSLIAGALGVGAIVPTILELTPEGFAGLEALLLAELGIVLNV